MKRQSKAEEALRSQWTMLQGEIQVVLQIKGDCEQILELNTQGLSLQDIADKLYISKSTVWNYLQRENANG